MRCFYLLVIVSVCQIAACTISAPPMANQQNSPSETLNRLSDSELERNKVLWQESHPRNYRMTIEYASGGFYPIASPVMIEVRNGKTVSLKPERANSGSTERYRSFDTVEKIFEQIANYRQAERLMVEFDAVRGYPTKLDIDPSLAAEDDGFNLNVRKLEVLEK